MLVHVDYRADDVRQSTHLYQARTGCQWRYLPHDLPPKSAVYYYFALWRDDGTTEAIHDLLRWQVREMRRRHEDPTAVVLDSQTVWASTNAPKDTTGLDPGKKSPGRKRGIATDVLGLVIAVVVVAASVHDNAIGIALLDKVAASAPTHRDQGVGGRRVQERRRRARRPAEHRRRGRPVGTRHARVHARAQAVGGRADLGHPDAAPQARARLRDEAGQLSGDDPLVHGRRHAPTPHPHLHPDLARSARLVSDTSKEREYR
ncbi:transposase [Kitasatospora sp. NPDC048545]|uniref:transposase n=1 Tax=Kitasatospora sp. NPDC048545 TaxID=3157208 RepID=UPI0033E15964